MDPRDSSPIVTALLEPIDGTVDLGDERVVGLLLRNYVDTCLARFQDALTGAASQDDAVEDIYAQASALNAVFLGTSGIGVVRAHPWNAPDQLGVYIRDTLDLDFPPDECVRAALVHMATQIMHTLQGARADWRSDVDALVEEMGDVLLGRTADDDGEPSYA